MLILNEVSLLITTLSHPDLELSLALTNYISFILK